MMLQHFEDPENFSAPEDDSPSCSQISKYSSFKHNHPNENTISRLNSMKTMDFNSLVKPSPFQQTGKSLSTAEDSPAKSLLGSQYNSGLSTTAGPFFFGSNSNLPSLLQKSEVISLDMDHQRESSSLKTGILKMGEKSKYSKGYNSWASVMNLPDMGSYNTAEDDSDSEAEEVVYPNKYVIEVSDDDEESQGSYGDYQYNKNIRYSQASQYIRSANSGRK